MTWKGRFYVIFALVVLSLFTVYGLPALWGAFNNPHAVQGRNWSLITSLAVIYGYSFVFFRNRFRERQLLANGELASGYVTAQIAEDILNPSNTASNSPVEDLYLVGATMLRDLSTKA
jgi:hypothetical protein